MKNTELTPHKLAQRRLITADFFTEVAINFLGGNMIILYALKIGAGNFLVGLYSALASTSFLFSFVGRFVVHRMGAVRTWATFWTLRYLLMLFVLPTVFPLSATLPSFRTCS